jgi:hypothetical protein
MDVRMRTFSSSSFFSERCFRLHAVSSRLSAISASFSCFFLRDVSSEVQWLNNNVTRNLVGKSETHPMIHEMTQRRWPTRLDV